MSMAADLHTHSTASDGVLAPAELMRRAHAAGLAAVALTDHDTVEGLTEAAAEARRLGLRLVPGVELSTDAIGREVHILGYYCRFEAEPFAVLLEEMRAARRERLERMVARLNAAGVPVALERVRALAGAGSAGRPHVARALVEAGHAADVHDAFARFLGRGRPGYVPRRKLHPADAVRAVVAAGGVAVLAHPGLVGDDGVIADLVAAGLGGIEADYPAHTPEQAARYRRLADDLGLIPTGGSDYHGKGEHWGDLGDVRVPIEVVDRLERAAAG